jgi:phage terminase large subunit-like protein
LIWNDYIKGVLSGKIIACKYLKLACQRHVSDLKKQVGTYPFYFDPEKAQNFIDFVGLLRHSSSDQHWQVHPSQAFRYAMVHGWRRKSDGKRRFRRAYVEMARKGAKTEEAAAMMIYGLIFDGEGMPQVLSAATTKDQANMSFRAARIITKKLKRDFPADLKSVEPFSHNISNNANNGFMRALASDANVLDGYNPHLIVVDEYHAHPTADVLNVLETGMGQRSQPLSYIITTAGFNINGPCYALRKTAIDILEGRKNDETFFTAIYTLDEGDDWRDVKVWAKANPMLGITPTMDFMRDRLQKAENEGGRTLVEFQTKNLNIWTNSVSTWIKDDVYMAGADEIGRDALKGRMCFVGLDLASTSDICSACYFFPARDETERHVCFWDRWTPEARVEIARQQGIPYDQWVNEGWLLTSPGNAVEYDLVSAKIVERAGQFNIKRVDVDPWNSVQIQILLGAQGIAVEKMPQSIGVISAPTKELQRIINTGKLQHGGDPVARWMFSNVAIYQDANDNIKVHKGKSRAGKVDDVCSLIDAVAGWMTYTAEPKAGDSYLFAEDSELILI